MLQASEIRGNSVRPNPHGKCREIAKGVAEGRAMTTRTSTVLPTEKLSNLIFSGNVQKIRFLMTFCAFRIFAPLIFSAKYATIHAKGFD